MGITYDALEQALAALSAGDAASPDEATFRRVHEMVDASAHKRALPPIFVRDGD
jgi:hypothetical protein